MRNTILAAALALAFPVAFAQGTPSGSSVELYGLLDTGLESLDVGGVSVLRLSSGISAGSRWGVRGRESLGNGYTALFTLESRIELDTGQMTNRGPIYYCGTSGAAVTCPGIALLPPATSLPAANQAGILGGVNSVNQTLAQAVTTVNGVGALFDRQALVGIITPVGALLLGRQYTPGYEILNKFNSFADATSGQMGQQYATLAIRANNAVQYRAEAAGAIVTAMYGFGGTDGIRTERSTNPTNGDDFMGFNAQYATSAFAVGVGYNQNKVVTFDAPGEARTGLKTLNVGVSGTFANFKLFGQYMSRKNDNPVLTPEDLQGVVISSGGNASVINSTLGALYINPWDVDGMRGFVGPIDTRVYHLGATWTEGNGTLTLAFNTATDSARSSWAIDDAKVKHYAIGYFYSFSKRTTGYGAVSKADNSGQSRLALGAAGYAGGLTTDFGKDSRAIQLGMRHAF